MVTCIIWMVLYSAVDRVAKLCFAVRITAVFCLYCTCWLRWCVTVALARLYQTIRMSYDVVKFWPYNTRVNLRHACRLCRDLSDGEKVAVKLFQRPLDPSLVDQVLRGIEIQADLGGSSTNVIAMHEVCSTSLCFPSSVIKVLEIGIGNACTL